MTPEENVYSILKNGLIPQIGGYASEMGETEPSVWLFPSLDDAEEMAPIWLEPYYGEGLAVLEADLPDDFPLEYTGSDYEVVTYEAVPAECIKKYTA